MSKTQKTKHLSDLDSLQCQTNCDVGTEYMGNDKITNEQQLKYAIICLLQATKALSRQLQHSRKDEP